MKKFAYITLLFVPLFFSSYASASEVNIYSYRQPFLIEPLTTAFTNKTGIKVNTVYLRKGMIERMKAEGKRSPADVVLTVDISRLSALVEAGLTQQVNSDHHDVDGGLGVRSIDIIPLLSIVISDCRCFNLHAPS